MDSISNDSRKEIVRLNNFPEHVESESGTVEVIHSFFSSLPSIQSLRSFQNLKELVVIGQTIPGLLFIRECNQLTKLWLCECGLESMQNVKFAVNLEELYLFDNKIKEIEGLENLISLRRLWLNSNRISELTCLQNLKNLEDLNVADNQIGRLNNTLVNCKSLKNINLSGNQFYDLQDFISLSLLPSLTSLVIGDPEFPPNILAAHKFTSVALIHHIPQLTKLDGIRLQDHLLRTVQAIVTHKKLFYFAKLRHRQNSLLRNQRNIFLLKKRISKPINERIRHLDLQCRYLEAHISRTVGLSKTTTAELKAVQKSLSEIRIRKLWWKSRLNTLDAEYEHIIANQATRLKLYRCIFTAELQSFGSVAITQVDRSAELFSLYRRFCQLRLCWHEKALEGFSELRLNNLWHICNSLLKIDSPSECGEELLFYECLFSSDVDFVHLGEFLRSGFHPRGSLGCLGFTTLLNKLVLLDAASFEKSYNTSFIVLLARSCKIEGCNYVRTGVVRPRANDCWGKKKRRFCACALAHFDYIFRESVGLYPVLIAELELLSSSASSNISQQLNRDHSKSPKEQSLIDNFVAGGTSRDSEVLKTKPDIPPPPDLSDTHLGEALRCSCFISALVQGFDAITELNFHGTGFRAFKELQQLNNLHLLKLSKCSLTSLCGLSVSTLESLDVSHNSLQTLDSLGVNPTLRHLDANWNSLTRLEYEISYLCTVVENLATIKMEHNPWNRGGNISERASFLLTLFSSNSQPQQEIPGCCIDVFRRLQTFALSRNYLLTLWPIAHTLSRSEPMVIPDLGFFLQNVKIWTGPLDCSSFALDRLTALHLNDAHLKDLDPLLVLHQLEELSVEGNCLVSLAGIHNLRNLKTLLVGDNFISTIDDCKFDELTCLQVLAFDNNELTSVTQLSRCLSLKQLFVSSNKISNYHSVLALAGLRELQVLDLRFNPLKSQISRYRMRILYHLPNLAFLDDTPVSANERNEAHETLDGRLSTEYLLASLGVDSATKLSHFDYEEGGIRAIELTPSDTFANLHTVNLQNNRLTTLDGLLQLRNVKVLLLAGNKISALSSVPTIREANVVILPNLAVFSLARNEISSLLPLQLHRFPLLKTLFLQENSLSSLGGLIGKLSLRHLVLDKNKIKKISDRELVSFQCLWELHLEENRLHDLPSLQPLQELQHLYLGHNKLESIESTLESIAGLERLTHLSLHDNPFAKLNAYRLIVCNQLRALKDLDGIEVTTREFQLAATLFVESEPHTTATSTKQEAELTPVSSSIRQKPTTKPLWKDIPATHINQPPMTSEGVHGQASGDGNVSTAREMSHRSNVQTAGITQRKRTVETKKSLRKVPPKNVNRRVVLSIPGISINAMAHFDPKAAITPPKTDQEDAEASSLNSL